MRRTSAMTLLATCACLPVLWVTPAHADNGYPPAGPPPGGGGGFTGGGGGVELPTTGGDLMAPAAFGAGATVVGMVLVLAGTRRSRRTG